MKLLQIKQNNLRRLTCDVDVDRGEGRQRHSGDILHSNPQHEIPGGLVVQGLRHQDGGGAVLSVGGQVEANWHVGLRDHAVLQVVSHPGIPERRSGLDVLFGTMVTFRYGDLSLKPAWVGLLIVDQN